MGSYCGCGTLGDHLSWPLGILLMILGTVFLITFFVAYSQDYNDYTKCLGRLERTGLISESEKEDALDFEIFEETKDNFLIENYREEYIQDSTKFIYFGLMIAFFVPGSIQFYIMCCCAKKPGECRPCIAQPVYVAQPEQPTYTYTQPTYTPLYEPSNVQMAKV
eukprot:TRINITY_DN16079_c0_g1_i1.p1 TRINITY_DN16079_c0_g1~~TRINITY_DN16079_c0_g1_i1.p1  ORF type:complete len:164 (+),score=11.72 TRINITY_DN16079_c0_g1_i1:99-590(+)